MIAAGTTERSRFPIVVGLTGYTLAVIGLVLTVPASREGVDSLYLTDPAARVLVHHDRPASAAPYGQPHDRVVVPGDRRVGSADRGHQPLRDRRPEQLRATSLDRLGGVARLLGGHLRGAEWTVPAAADTVPRRSTAVPPVALDGARRIRLFDRVRAVGDPDDGPDGGGNRARDRQPHERRFPIGHGMVLVAGHRFHRCGRRGAPDQVPPIRRERNASSSDGSCSPWPCRWARWWRSSSRSWRSVLQSPSPPSSWSRSR